MRKPIDVSIPFVASIGAPGVVRVQLECAPSRNAILSIEVRYPQFSKGALASLTAADARQLVDGLMDCVQALERDERQSRASARRVLDGREWNEVPR